ncbi:Plasminogen activator inhibitor 1 RNA-binding protein [Sciurus carolinensis]|uniref:Plasminogen activator inhibitor 1 RNA-binding protein n=1 Tax=Sciurus carolinensis TaxID=30640 RepID=A0AA41MD14_SCICA|nr:Plasminogen activator inhibitor 1 RNA-binding protein [Sciurus carolinensis]
MKKVGRAEAGALGSAQPAAICGRNTPPSHHHAWAPTGSFDCVVTNQLDQLFEDKSDPFQVLKAAENKKKKPAGVALGDLEPKTQLRLQPRPTPRRQAKSYVKSPRKNPLSPTLA